MAENTNGRPLPRFAAGLAWSVAVVALFFGVAVVSFLAGRAATHMASYAASMPVRGAVAILGMTLVAWFVRVRLNKKPWAGLALPAPQLPRLVLGGLCGALVILAVFALEYVLGWLHFARISLAPHMGVGGVAIVLLALVSSLGTGFSEELAFRGYIFQTLGERSPVWVATLAMGTIFALVHAGNGGFGLGFVGLAFLISTLFVVLRFATGSLWFPIGFHAMYDWTQTYFAAVPSSGYNPQIVQLAQSGPSFWMGNAQGPGVIDILSIVAAIAIALVYCARAARQPLWSRRLQPDGAQ